jgi:Tol biopolymer transport system component
MPVEPQTLQFYLDKISASSEFFRSGRMVKFLRLVVAHTLEERSEPLKERLIGIEVFDRSVEYDPKLDPIVRIEARRLREKLQKYYASEGSFDQIRISIPKGGYKPRFEALAILTDSPDTALNPPARGSSKGTKNWRVPLVFSISFLLLAFCIYRFSRLRKETATQTNASFETAQFANEIGEEFSPAVSPDGQTIAYVWDGNGPNLDIYLKSVNTGARSRFTMDSAADLSPAWSPDGRFIAFLRSSRDSSSLIIKPATGGPERLITQIRTQSGTWTGSTGPLTGDSGPAWSPDGRHLVVSAQGDESKLSYGLYLISVATGEQRKLTDPPREDHDFYPRFSPDGKVLAFVRYSSHAAGEIFVMPADGGEPRRLTPDSAAIRGITWTPNSRRLIYALQRINAGQLWSIDYSSGERRQISLNSAAAADPSMAMSADWLAYVETNENWNIWRARLTSSEMGAPEQFISSSGRNHTPRYSPDGKQIAFVSDRSGAWEIWLCNLDGSVFHQLTHFNGSWLGGLSWSPDGRMLAFDARPNQHSNIFLISAHGGPAYPIEQNSFEERLPVWSRDGQFIYFNSNRDGIVALWRRSLASGTITRVSKSMAFASSESADGHALYFDQGNGEGIWRCLPDGTQSATIPGLEHVLPYSNWTVSDKGIYFADGSGEGKELQSLLFYQFSGGQAKVIGKAGRPLIHTPSMTISPDGQWLLYVQRDYAASDIKILHGSVN